LALAEDALARFSRQHGIDLSPALDHFCRRAAALASTAPSSGDFLFDAGFGRPLDYYSGLVFEIHGFGPAALAGGGRYDRLLTMLGAPVPVPGVGYSIWLDRVEAEAQR